MIHPASLVDQSLHSSFLLRLLPLQINKTLTGTQVFGSLLAERYESLPGAEFTVRLTTHVIDHATLSIPPELSRIRDFRKQNFTILVERILSIVTVTTPVVLVALIYIRRAKGRLNIVIRQWALERVFLGSMILAYKYLNDSCIRNVEWARCSGIFGIRDIGRIEREFLDLLDWDLGISERDILNLFPEIHEEAKVQNGIPPEAAIEVATTTSPCTRKRRKRIPSCRSAHNGGLACKHNEKRSQGRRTCTRKIEVEI
ncbi:hypothetical protein V5O48_003331 [Marasmius crinis-equi]|uniref:Cyclin N-terminal domain-containing protein n=1 Tax=Marasmius crinis-equi TaxID=585013 RepID=A0ABR3FTY7_9AGAR